MPDFKDKILFLETSEEKIEPERLKEILTSINSNNLFKNVKGVILGKPIDEMYYDEYKIIYKDFFSKLNISTLYNVNFGHAVPRCIIPYGLNTELDLDNKKITILESFFRSN